jgi:hypothetical protein
MGRTRADRPGKNGDQENAMPLSEDEQRILREIEANLSVTDPKLVQQVSDTTLYRHASRMIKWAAIGFVVGLVLLLATFTSVLALGVVGFLIMLFCLLVIERNVRKMGRAGLESLTGSMPGGALKGMFGDAGQRWRERFQRDDDTP